MAYPDPNIVVSNTTLGIGGTALVTFTFDQDISGFTNADLTVANGSLSTLNVINARTYTATLTPDAGVSDTTNIIIFNNEGVIDAGGVRAGDGLTLSANYVVDTVRPTATIVLADSALAAGQTSLVTFTFSEAVTGFANANLTIGNGTLSSVSSADGGITYTATLTPTAALNEPVNVITLDYSGVTDLAGNAGTGSTTSANYVLDSTAPTATVVVADTALAAGETSLVTITFSEAVTSFTNADLTVGNGVLTTVSSVDGGISYTTTFTPTASIVAGANVITLANADLTDLAGNAGSGTTDSNNYGVSTVRPGVTVSVSDTSLALGDTSNVSFTFSEAVTGFDNADITIANGALSTVATSDNITFTATLTPTTAITDTTNAITVANTGYAATSSSNAGIGTTDSNTYAVDTARPTATIVLADTALTTGETSLVTITFSEAVSGFNNSDLTIGNGSLSTVASDAGVTWTATFTPSVPVSDTTNIITLAGSGVTDAAGNAGSGTYASANFTIVTSAPLPDPEPIPPVAPGSTAPDVIVGDAQNNLVTAGAGNDTAGGGLGADSISGDAGDDVVQGNAGNDDLAGGTGDDVVLGGQDNDQVQGNTENDYVSGDKGNDIVHGGQGDDVAYGGEGDDFVFGDRDNDIVRGGQGDDLVQGGDGDDYVSGDRGSDTITGGAGSDLFHSFGEAGMDLVTDFDRTQGDRVFLDFGTTYTTSQVASDTVIDMSGGGQMILVGVQLSTLTPGWIFVG